MENQENQIDLMKTVFLDEGDGDNGDNGDSGDSGDGDGGGNDGDLTEQDVFGVPPATPAPTPAPASSGQGEAGKQPAAPPPYSLSSGSSAVVGATPYGVHQTARRVVAANSGCPFYQQSLTFELIDNIGLDGAKGGGRAIRISTDGTSILTGAVDGHDRTLSFATIGGIRSQIRSHYWEILGQKESYDPDNALIFDYYNFTIQPVDPIDGAGVSNGASDWLPVDISPTSKNADQQYTTSTSTGINLGFMGGTLTGGFSMESSSSRSWSLPDYDLFGVMGSAMPGEHHASWTVKRGSKDSVGDIATSAFCPKLEAVFCLSPNKIKKRYSFFSILTNFTFIVKKTSSGKIFSFVSTFVIDWRDGLVYPFVPAKSIEDGNRNLSGNGLIYLASNNGSIEDFKRSRGNGVNVPMLMIGDIEEALKPIVPVDQKVKKLSFGLRQNSPIGFAVDLSKSEFVEGYVNDYGLGYFASGYRVSSGLFRQDQDFALGSIQSRAGLGLAQFPSVGLDLPFNNSVRVKGDALAPVYWLMPKFHISDQVAVVKDIAKDAKEAEFTPTFDTVDVLGVPEAPDSLNCDPGGGKTYMLYRDHVFLYTNEQPAGQCSPEVYRAGATGISTAIFSQDHSIGLLGGEIWFSRDQLKSFELNISDLSFAPKAVDKFSDVFLQSFSIDTIGDFLGMTDDPRLFLLRGGKNEPLIVVLGRMRGMVCSFDEMRDVINKHIVYKKVKSDEPVADKGGVKAVDHNAPSIKSTAFVFDLQDPSYLTGKTNEFLEGKENPLLDEVLELVIHHQLLLGTGKRLISCLDLRSNSAPFLTNLNGNNVIFSGPAR